ncbi:UDP-Glycosyltransferase superfamily protein [Striga asiatica]|uniref:UDP-Glycosyltransferase superfamily protein n=1 Tax=Striga asiatica TaxID=4170 RepID=A0A5A7Q875_STRAF|nr:UDP-Glycosyltransferase superfamily protein [Striga asiatica]
MAATAISSSFYTPNTPKSLGSRNWPNNRMLRFSCTKSLQFLSLSHQRLSPTSSTKWRILRLTAAVAQEEAEAAAALTEQPAEEEAAEELPDGGVGEEESGGETTKLYFGNLPYLCDSSQLAGIIQEYAYASPELVEVLYDRESGKSRGFAFVTMSSIEECNTVIQHLDGKEFGGRTMRVNFSDKPRPKVPLYPETEHKLFVGNLSWTVTSEILTQAFQEHGDVVGARVLYDGETGKSRGYGFGIGELNSLSLRIFKIKQKPRLRKGWRRKLPGRPESKIFRFSFSLKLVQAAAAMAADENGIVHILIVPYPAQGHMLPLLDLAHHLAARGLSITILITSGNLPILAPILAAHPSSVQTLTLPFPSHPSIPAGVEHIKDLGNQGNLPMIAALSALQDPISDFFLGWTHRLAARLAVPRIVFFSSGAFAVDLLNSLWVNSESVDPGAELEFPDFPGSPSFPWEHIPSVFRRYKESGPSAAGTHFNLHRTSMIDNFSAWAAITNSFQALEGPFLAHMKKAMSSPRFYTVGPLNIVSRPGPDSPDPQNHAVISWLDECNDDSSVLFVCFGSQKVLSTAQMEALANGLDKSKARFIWATNGPVPDGFDSRVSGRGLVLRGWAPQRAILGHRAVGWFLSHCGWNSLLEAVVAGPVILGWPMEADQFVNAKLLVDYLGAAFRVCEGGDTVPDPDELARKISESIRVGSKERARAKELRDGALEAIAIGGSSNRDLDGLVQELEKPNSNKCLAGFEQYYELYTILQPE